MTQTCKQMGEALLAAVPPGARSYSEMVKGIRPVPRRDPNRPLDWKVVCGNLGLEPAFVEAFARDLQRYSGGKLTMQQAVSDALTKLTRRT